MSEYETAALAISQAQVGIMQAQVTAQYVSAVISAVIGAGQIGLIWYGLRRMSVASEQRDRQLDQQGEALGEISRGLTQQSEVLAELLRRSA